ncbi:MAG: M48 family metalloprotease [Firmicutes bacterium]|jgi:predicted Zn-dependent protease|nr:M48 family metalloprotease [Bacillota bacterium]
MQHVRPVPRSGRLYGGAVVLIGLLALVLSLATASAAQNVSAGDAMLLGIELGMGRAVDSEIVYVVGPPTTLPPAHKAWVEAIFRDMVAQTRRRDIRYLLRVLDSEMVNAFSAPGGFIYLTTGLLEHLGNHGDALANVIGHELAHVELRHALHQLLRSVEVGLWVSLGAGLSEQSEAWRRVEEVGMETVLLGWSRQQELEADALGQRMAAAAGYDPMGLVAFFDMVELVEKLLEPELADILTHPSVPERKQRARVLAAQLPVAERKRPEPAPPAELPDLSSIIERLERELQQREADPVFAEPSGARP